MVKEKIQKQRIIIWNKKDSTGNETAFALIDFRAPENKQPPENIQESKVKK